MKKILFYILTILIVNLNIANSQSKENYYGEEFSVLDIKDYSSNKLDFLNNPENNMVDNSNHLSPKQATKKFNMLVKKGIGNFIRKPVKNYRGKNWIKKQKILQKEDVDLPVNVGDTIMMGRFKNKKVVVKDISWNEKGDLLINGRPALKFRIVKEGLPTKIKQLRKIKKS